MNIFKLTIIFTFAAYFITSCNKKVVIPLSFQQSEEKANIYPDYKDIVIPPNIAPLNFMINNEGEHFIACIKGNKTTLIAEANEDGKIYWDSLCWKQMLQETLNGNDSLVVSIYTERNQAWFKLQNYFLKVAKEPIDPYLSFRLIEPSYELYRQLGLYQRNLTNFDQQTIYENNRSYDQKNNHCINCHNYQNYDTKKMLFHIRGSHGGTLIAIGDDMKKINPKNDSILGSCVYPSWHPKHNWIAFSTNKTGQTFHLLNKEKIEVVDYASDLIFYDYDKNTIKNIFHTKADLENYPCWAPEGDRLYYTCAHVEDLAHYPDSIHSKIIVNNYDSIYYNIYSIPFDTLTQKFGKPQIEVNCELLHKSATIPRISPNGRYLLFSLADYGQFHIWHKSSDLFVKDLKTGTVYPLSRANSTDVDSYHTWSSNNRWIVFSSRRDDQNYTRPYIAYFDKNGKDYKAFIIPQEDPEQHLMLLKSYNVPELTKTKVEHSAKDFKDVIYNTKAQHVKYTSN